MKRIKKDAPPYEKLEPVSACLLNALRIDHNGTRFPIDSNSNVTKIHMKATSPITKS